MAILDLKNKVMLKAAAGAAFSAVLMVLFFFTHYVPFGFPNQRDKLNALKSDFEKKSTDLARARAFRVSEWVGG